MVTLLTDELWCIMASVLPMHRPSAKGGHPRCDDRKCLEGILYVLRGGIAWRLLPKDFGVSPVTCWRRFDEWTNAGVWDKAHRKLLTRLAEKGALDIDRVIVDSASVRAVKGGHTRGRTQPTAPSRVASGT